MSNLLKKIAHYFSPANQKLREAKKIVPLINSKEEEFIKFSHQDILNKTQEFKQKVKEGTPLDHILVEAFALVREASKRVLYQRPYDVQMMGAYILHKRMIAEMYTGEGKTLVAIIAAYLNGLTEKGLQIVTVNDYLAKRDSEETGKVLKYLGLTVGLIQEDLDQTQKQEQYKKDVTYVSNHEFAFDYLRDNMEMYPENQVMIDRINYCIVDECDSVLLDEATTPLIISGSGPKSSYLYEKLTPVVQKLNPSIHLQFDEFRTRAELTEEGMDFLEDELVKISILQENKNILKHTEIIPTLLVKDYINLMVNELFYKSDNAFWNQLLGTTNEKTTLQEKFQKSFDNLLTYKQNNNNDDAFNNQEDVIFYKNLLPIIEQLKPFVHYYFIYQGKISETNYTANKNIYTNRDLINCSITDLNYLNNYEIFQGEIAKLKEKNNFEDYEDTSYMGYSLQIKLTPNGEDFIRKKAMEKKILEMEGLKEDWTINKHKYQTFHDTIHRINQNLYEPKNLLINHYISQIIKANFIMKKDVDYIVSNSKEIVIIDQHTGRLGFGRRFSDGLHQALEAKEKVEVKEESVTIASTTYQSFFQLFQLAGMTGTAKESEEEFIDVYKLEVVSIPTNRISRKKIHKDILFFKNEDRLQKINEIVVEKHKKGQPILIITLTVNDSEIISKSLTRKKIPHHLLNAKNHEEEAEIIRNAGKFGSVTVATDIAGRGTDIQLGGSRSHILSMAQERNASEEEIEKLMDQLAQDKEKISAIGGLAVLCIGRHESERLDNQASGRCGRQGEPGEVFFFLSFEDELIQNGSSNFQQFSFFEILESEDNFAEGYMVDTFINSVQKQKSALNYESRKNLFRYDKIVDIQRKILYNIRNNLLRINIVNNNFQDKQDLLNKSYFFILGQKIINNIAEKILFNIDYTNLESIEKAKNSFHQLFNLDNEILIENNTVNDNNNILSFKFIQKLNQLYKNKLEEKITNGSTVQLAQNFKNHLISFFDKTIQKYLQAIVDSKDGSYLSSYAQKDPINEFNKRMMNILGDFFIEWQKLFIEHVFYDGQKKSPEDLYNLKGDDLSDMSYDESNNKPEESLEELENFIKNNQEMFNSFKNQLTPDQEEERIKLKNEISKLLLDHLKNSGAIEYVDENNNQEKLQYSQENIDEIMNTLQTFSDHMDIEQLKQLKDDLLSKIHDVREFISEDSPEYQDTIYNEIQRISNLENVMSSLKNIMEDSTAESWKKLQKILVEEIESMEQGDEIEYDDTDEFIADILDDIQEILNNSDPSDWEKIKQNIISQIDAMNSNNNHKPNDKK